MAQEPVEVILAKQLAGLLSVPILVYNATGDITYYNEATERLTGLRFNETGRISRDSVEQRFHVADREERPAPRESRPEDRLRLRPGHARFVVRATTWEGQRELEATRLPLISVSGEVLGALMMLWERDAG